jgi:DNA-binding transcriptional ArsR family regulator/uncharacterized protein YndB with AHSA1/START domain
VLKSNHVVAYSVVTMDAVFKALADPSRRRLLDSLNTSNGQTLRELCAGLDMTRQAVSKHLAVLEAASLVTTVRRGREKLHYLNPVPINEIAERWIDRYDQQRVRALADLKIALEDTVQHRTEFVYVTYIGATPERLWRALTEPAFTRIYWGAALKSDWKVGSKVLWQHEPDEEYEDLDQVVLESDPPLRLSYTWHTYQRRWMEMFGWSEGRLAELVKEKRSKVAFEIEPAGPICKLTVTHDDFEPDSEMLNAVSQGWPAILSALKTLLETGELAGVPAPE